MAFGHLRFMGYAQEVIPGLNVGWRGQLVAAGVETAPALYKCNIGI